MKTGDIVIVPFPFADAPVRKVRPAVVVGLASRACGFVILNGVKNPALSYRICSGFFGRSAPSE